MMLYMMTKQVDPAQMLKQAVTVENGHKAVQEAVKLVKQLSDMVDKLKGEAATNKRKVDDVTKQLETIKKKVNTGKAWLSWKLTEGSMKPDLCLADEIDVPPLNQRWNVESLTQLEEPPTKLQKVIRSVPHSSHGSNGALMVNTEIPKIPCDVIGNVFPSWVLHVLELGYQIEQVLVQVPSLVECIHKVCGMDVPIWSGANFPDLIGAWAPQGDETVCFVDGRVTSGLLTTLLNVGIQEVVSTQTPWQGCQGWYSTFIAVPHSEVGGVTTWTITITWHSRSVLLGFPVLERTAQRDAATVLSHSTFGRHFLTPPTNVFVEPLCCLNLGLVQHPYYHGNRWLAPGKVGLGSPGPPPVLNSGSHSD
jgi:hypothetical protein